MTIPQQNTDQLRALLVSVDFDKKQILNDGIEFYDTHVEILFHTRDSQENAIYTMSIADFEQICLENGMGYFDYGNDMHCAHDFYYYNASTTEVASIISGCLDKMYKEVVG